MATLKSYKSRITRALKNCGCHHSALGIQVDNLASAMLTRDMATRAIEELDSPIVMETTKYGEKPAPHPAFKIQRDAMEQVNRQLKQLKLTVADVVGEPDKPGPLDILTEELEKI